MIFPDEWIMAAIASIAAYIAYIQKYLMIEMKTVVEKNTIAVNILTAIVSKCEAKK